jgi:L-aspartate oxidase
MSILEQEVDEYYASFTITKELLELRNLTLVAKLMVDSARSRKESRGLHFNRDHPAMLSEGRDTVLIPQGASSSSTELPKYTHAES